MIDNKFRTISIYDFRALCVAYFLNTAFSLIFHPMGFDNHKLSYWKIFKYFGFSVIQVFELRGDNM